MHMQQAPSTTWSVSLHGMSVACASKEELHFHYFFIAPKSFLDMG